MAKKIRQVKLTEDAIHKNSGKEISHTISKIKAHERLYTFLLVIVFMVTICISIFLGLRVDTYQLYDADFYQNGVSITGQLLALSSKNIMSDADGLKSNTYIVGYTNNTGRDINFLVRLAYDEQNMEKCKCEDKLVNIRKIKFSINGEIVQQFSDEAMIITAGMLKSHDSGELTIRFWLDEELKEEEECFFYGKFILEELEDMDS